MKRIFNYLNVLIAISIIVVGFTSCEEETEPAYVNIHPYIEKYEVTWAIKAIGVSSFTWDYGDGTTSNETGVHSHIYENSGDYTVTVTATGEGGTATTVEYISIAPGIAEIMAGSDDNGKTWVLTQEEGNFAGSLGPGPVANDMEIYSTLIPNGVMAYAGLGAEYTDEFTFYRDGTYKVSVKNNQSLAGLIYGSITELIRVPSNIPDQLPLCAIAYQDMEGTWELSYEDKVVTTFNMFTSQTIEDVTFTFAEDDRSKEAELKLSTGSYIGFADLTYPAIPQFGLPEPVDNSFYIIREVTPSHMHIAIGLSAYVNEAGMPFLPNGMPVFQYPTMILHLTLVPK